MARKVMTAFGKYIFLATMLPFIMANMQNDETVENQRNQDDKEVFSISNFTDLKKLCRNGQPCPDPDTICVINSANNNYNTYRTISIKFKAKFKEDTIPYSRKKLRYKFFYDSNTSLLTNLNLKFSGYNKQFLLINNSYIENGDIGEKFTRKIMLNDFSTPYVKVTGERHTHYARFELKTIVEDKSKFSGFSEAIGAMSNALDFVTPTSSLLTKISKPSFSKKAEALEGFISHNMALSITETASFDLPVNTNCSYEIRAYAPYYETDPQNRLQLIGIWQIQFEDEIYSLFSQKSGLDVIYNDGIKNGNNALNYKLIENTANELTISQHLKQQEWWSGKTQNLDSAGKYNDLCKSIISEMIALGLVEVDAAIIANASVNSSMIINSNDTHIKGAKSCNNYFQNG